MGEAPSYEQEMFLHEFVQLKADACYVRDRRNRLGRYVTTVAAIRAITSCASIGAWAIWKEYAFLWGAMIAIAQVVDALKGVFPFEKRRVALSRWATTLDRLFVGAQRDWDSIASGYLTNAEIRKLLHRLRDAKQRAEARAIPNGLERDDQLAKKTEAEAYSYFRVKYGVEIEEEAS